MENQGIRRRKTEFKIQDDVFNFQLTFSNRKSPDLFHKRLVYFCTSKLTFSSVILLNFFICKSLLAKILRNSAVAKFPFNLLWYSLSAPQHGSYQDETFLVPQLRKAG